MAIKLMTLVWETNLPQTEKMVLLALADHANDDGICWPKQQQLTVRCSMSERTVRRVIGSLVETGFISKVRNYRCTTYRINKEALSNRSDLPVSAESNRSLWPVQPVTVAGSIITVKNHHISPSQKTTASARKNSKTISPHAWFSRWWSFSFEKMTGSRYAYSKKAAGMIKNLIDQLPIEELVERSCVFFTLPDKDRFPRGSPTLEGLANMINQLGGRCTEEIEDRCYAAGLLPDYGTDLFNHQPWGQVGHGPAPASKKIIEDNHGALFHTA